MPAFGQGKFIRAVCTAATKLVKRETCQGKRVAGPYTYEKLNLSVYEHRLGNE
jgi:hypothetical protein